VIREVGVNFFCGDHMAIALLPTFDFALASSHSWHGAAHVVVFPRKAVAAEGPHRLEINSEFLKQNVVDGEAYLLGMTIRHLARHGLGAGWACAGYGDRETVARPP
jgi:hypothetical protein